MCIYFYKWGKYTYGMLFCSSIMYENFNINLLLSSMASMLVHLFTFEILYIKDVFPFLFVFYNTIMFAFVSNMLLTFYLDIYRRTVELKFCFSAVFFSSGENIIRKNTNKYEILKPKIWSPSQTYRQAKKNHRTISSTKYLCSWLSILNFSGLNKNNNVSVASNFFFVCVILAFIYKL